MQKVVIGGEDFFPPNLEDEPINGRIHFIDDITDGLTTSFCGALFFQIINFQATAFNLQDAPSILIGLCILNENMAYSHVYYSVFYDQPTYTAKNPFSYSISTINNVTILVITNGDGDVAIYGNELLSNQDFNKTAISLYPNPVKTTLQITTPNNITVKHVVIYDVMGKRVLVSDATQLDVSGLASGLFFVKIETDQGVLVKKVVKE